MSSFVKVAKFDDVPTQTGLFVEVDGQPVALYKVDGKIHAIHNVCPHQGGPLSEGSLNGTFAMCPWHGWEFDVTTGACQFNDSIKVQCYQVKVEGDDVLLST